MMDTNRKQSLIDLARWRVETDLADGPSLTSLAARLGVSPFHLTRAFTLLTGQPLMAYVQARRLTEAAHALAEGRENVTGAGLLAGYDSAEGFSRAFRARFGRAPSSIRRPEDLAGLPLQEPLIMSPETRYIPKARIETYPGARLIGRGARFDMESRSRIPAFWQEANESFGEHLEGRPTFGVCHDFQEDGSFAYFIGVEGDTTPEGLERLELPAGRYAAFEHEGDIGSLSRTWGGIFGGWAETSGEEIGEGPEFELYEADYNPMTPGGIAVWVPLAR
ncbi:effector binding domain-containing protein [Pseudoroseicyclus sp. CXY001]|uniref:AraC family transcriptional regulator n=1 Tax=Pseudoroseicyclus sp. CXY001 TaxID=3242492 RepID=UPI003571258D